MTIFTEQLLLTENIDGDLQSTHTFPSSLQYFYLFFCRYSVVMNDFSKGKQLVYKIQHIKQTSSSLY